MFTVQLQFHVFYQTPNFVSSLFLIILCPFRPPSGSSKVICPTAHVCPAGSKTPHSCASPFFEANTTNQECEIAVQNIGLMIGICIVIVVVGGFICYTANQKDNSEAGSPGYPRGGHENRRFKSGPRQIYDPAKANYKEDEVYFSGERDKVLPYILIILQCRRS